MDKYVRASTAIGKLLSKKYGIHMPLYTPIDTGKLPANDSDFDSNLLGNNFQKHISIGCLRCVGEWIAAASELIKASNSASLGNVWETDLGKDLANALITRRLTLTFADFYELLKFFALIRDEKLQVLSQLLDVKLKSITQSNELAQIEVTKLLQLPLLIHLSNVKVDNKIIEFITFISQYVKRKIINENNGIDLKLCDIVSAQIGFTNLGLMDQQLMKILNKKILELPMNTDNSYNLQLYNTSILANTSCYIHDIEFYAKLIGIINDNLNMLPPSHITTHTLVRAIIANIYHVDNSQILHIIFKNYRKMSLEDKITVIWSIISLGLDENPEYITMVNNLFTSINNVNISAFTRLFLDQIYITAKLDGYIPHYSIITPVKSFNNHTCHDNRHFDDLSRTVKKLIYNINSNTDKLLDDKFAAKKPETTILGLPYYEFNLVLPLTHQHGTNYDQRWKGIAITLYKQLNCVDNPLLWDPYYTIRRKHLHKIGYKDVFLPINWIDLSQTQLIYLLDINVNELE